MKKQNGFFTKFESTAKFALIVVALAVMTGCTATATVGSVSTPTENQVPEEAKNQTSLSGTNGGENISDSLSAEQPHEHIFETITSNDGTHTMRCTGEGCDEVKTEACSFNEDYVCTVCGFKHEHEYSVEPVSKEDGTHIYQCPAEYCDAFTSENCSFDEEYTCTVCGFKHEHTLEALPDYKGHHTATCTADYCDYTVNEDCTNENNLCPTCGFEFPTWKVDYIDAEESLTYYVHEETVIKNHPFEDEEPIGTAHPGDELNIIGWTRVSRMNYDLLSDGTYVRDPIDPFYHTSALEDYPYGKVLVLKRELKNNRNDITDRLIYDSMEDAMNATLPCSFDELKKIWKYSAPYSDMLGLDSMHRWSNPDKHADQSKGCDVATYLKDDKCPYSYTREQRWNNGQLEYELSYVYLYHHN